jgi:8-oxo-dGTP pyrophosphatase MutT (NUDIX family)
MTDWHAHTTVATVVEKNGKFLVVEELKENGLVINQPAGHLEPGESLQDAARRETLEETGWTVELTGLLGTALYTSPDNGVTYHRTTFLATALHHDPERPLDSGIERALWLSRDELQADSARMRSPLVLATIDQYLSGKLYPLDFIYYP